MSRQKTYTRPLELLGDARHEHLSGFYSQLELLGVLDGLSLAQGPYLLRAARQLLTPGGELTLAVGRLDTVAQLLPGASRQATEMLIAHLYGDNDRDARHSVYTPELLSTYLIEAGFVDVELIDAGMMLHVRARTPRLAEQWASSLLP